LIAVKVVSGGVGRRSHRPFRASKPLGESFEEQVMLDVILLAAGLGFFALSIAYAFGCDLL